MLLRRTRTITTLIALMVLSVSLIEVTSQAQLGSPTTLPFESAFENIHGAEVAGADVKSLIAQFNSLLSQPQNSTSYSSVNNQAVQLQTSALGNRRSSLFSIILQIPVISLVLAILSIIVLTAVRRARDNRLLSMRLKWRT